LKQTNEGDLSRPCKKMQLYSYLNFVSTNNCSMQIVELTLLPSLVDLPTYWK